MDGAKSEEEWPRCIGCGRRVKTLFVQYSPGNIRLMKCDYCKAVADPYIECEFMIILIDLILHKTRAYRHLLFNKLRIYSSLTRISFSRGNKADGDSSISTISGIFNCGKIMGVALLGNIIFMDVLLLEVQIILKLSFDTIRLRPACLVPARDAPRDHPPPRLLQPTVHARPRVLAYCASTAPRALYPRLSCLPSVASALNRRAMWTGRSRGDGRLAREARG
ncbi:hypothetical protein GUJ93_ZPchr0013g36817 [Zizania palustris]|uniref:Protein ARV n=1 Tax=Zizania palustris TaxID=103762 RepID=A0A8J5WZ90_ZIZPA|nr:hypothetical protein GUJ93_ZPchr0013g36817 [Zizania palustris]